MIKFNYQPSPHLKRLFDEIGARAAEPRAVALQDRHAFAPEMDEEARRNRSSQTVSDAA
jgi:hypothetical protein